MKKMLLILIGILLFTCYLQAQDTTALRSKSFSDTAKITITQGDSFLLQLNSQKYSGYLMSPLRLRFDNTLQFNPTSHLSTYNHYNSIENRILSTQRTVQSIQLNLQSSLQPNKVATTIGILINSACLGGVVYQMMQSPKPDPNHPPKGVPPRQDPAPMGNPKPVK